jgi:hypothetical protein
VGWKKMRIIIFILTLLLASLHAHSENIDSVYAEYCLNFERYDDMLSVNLLLVKKYKDLVSLKTMLLKKTKKPIECEDYFFYPTIEFEFVDESGKEKFTISSSEGNAWYFGGFGLLGCTDCYPAWTEPIISKMIACKLKPKVQIDIDMPSKMNDIVFAEDFPKEDILRFKNKIIDAYAEASFSCKPHIDTISPRTNFHVKITGECEKKPETMVKVQDIKEIETAKIDTIKECPVRSAETKAENEAASAAINRLKAEKLERVKPEIATLELKKMEPTEITERITSDLNEMAMRYKQGKYGLLNRPLPACKQCSELEMLLLLERTVKYGIVYSEEGDIKKLLYHAKNKDGIIESELKKAEAEYEKKFGQHIPWWWVCSDKERIKRLEKALEANKPYPGYYSSKAAYELGKATAGYEMFFKKQPPEWRCSDKERLKRLERSLEVDVPYLTQEEEAELEVKLRAEHKKKNKIPIFREPITDFELSVASVYFYTVPDEFDPFPRISLVKTPTGAIAKYLPPDIDGERLEIKLDIREWLDIVNALLKYQVNEWAEKYEVTDYGVYGVERWRLEIIFSDKNELRIVGFNEYPPNWDKFIKIMNDIKTKIKKDTTLSATAK